MRTYKAPNFMRQSILYHKKAPMSIPFLENSRIFSQKKCWLFPRLSSGIAFISNSTELMLLLHLTRQYDKSFFCAKSYSVLIFAPDFQPVRT